MQATRAELIDYSGGYVVLRLLVRPPLRESNADPAGWDTSSPLLFTWDADRLERGEWVLHILEVLNIAALQPRHLAALGQLNLPRLDCYELELFDVSVADALRWAQRQYQALPVADWREEWRRPGLPTQCPRCDSERIVPIVYGLPLPRMYAASLKNVIRLGGCDVSPSSPIWTCLRCELSGGVLVPEAVWEHWLEQNGPRFCPRCESPCLVRVLYGAAAESPVASVALGQGMAFWTDEAPTPGAPAWHCQACGFETGLELPRAAPSYG